jgi:iron complex outermembrane recepter protein
MGQRLFHALLLTCAAALTLPGVAFGRMPAPAAPAVAQDRAEGGEIIGRVIDAMTGAPVANAYVRLLELGRNELSHQDGAFHFSSLSPRTYTVLAQRIGYAPVERRIEVADGETLPVVLEMTPSALEVPGIVVTGTGRERGTGETFRPTTVVGEAELRRRLESSVTATIAHVPGISQRYNGPVATQPVVRGMGGDRVLVLEDGQRTGDLATSGADHALTIDPVTAQRIEVVRGPAGLMYGSNALGGVINVVREEVPRSLPESVTGSAGLQAESVNEGIGAGAAIVIPHGGLAIRGELSGRFAGDTGTPLGDLPSSDTRGYGGALGASWIASWGFLGAAYRDFDSRYGVPSEFRGELIPGAHPEGVRIDSRRRSGRVEAGHLLGFGPISSISLDANLVYYEHRELEGAGEDMTAGASFNNLFGGGNLVIRHEHELDPVFTEGAIGFYASGRDLDTGGGFTGSRDASATSLATYLYEELAVSRFRLQMGGRYDWTRVTPNDLSPIRTATREVPVRERTFGAISGSVAGLVEIRPDIVGGASVARAFRTPSVEELFSDGPHLADYSYNIGSPELEPEIGVGADLFVRISRPTFHAEVTLFRNWLTNYIHYAPTGELDPRLRRFPVFEARGADAVFTGAETGVQWEATRGLVLEGALSGVRATRRDTGEPLPAIPPINGFVGARYETDRFFLTGGMNGARGQNRVPDPLPAEEGGEEIVLERPTPAHALLNVGGGVRWLIRGRLNTITLQVDNLADTVWRDHLSRIKEVAPQPGRNIQLLYRVQF